MDLVSDTYKQTTDGCKWKRKKTGFISIDPGKSIKDRCEYAESISEYIESEERLINHTQFARPLYRSPKDSNLRTTDLRTSASLRGYVFESMTNIIASLDLKTFRNPRLEYAKRTGRKRIEHLFMSGRLGIWGLYDMYNKNGHVTSRVPYKIPKKK